MTRRPAIHYGQLLAAVVTFAAMTWLLSVGAAGVDGANRAAWAGPFGGIFTAWVGAAVLLLLTLALSVKATWRQLRPRRPAPGTSGRPVPSLTDLANRNDYAGQQMRLIADAWTGGDEQQLVAHLTAVVAAEAEARHAVRSAA